MAQKVQILLTDDIDGSEAAETVSFAIDGSVYEIDLSERNVGQLRKVLSPYVEHARRATASAQRRRRPRPASHRERSTEIREWAKARGYKVSERGRIPANIMTEFQNAEGK